MTLVDLTHSIDDTTPVFPGTPKVETELFSTVEKDGYREKIVRLVSHTGTHADAPAHMLSGGKTFDNFPVSAFYGKAAIIDVRNVSQSELKPDILNNTGPVDYVIFYTGWSDRWGTDEYLLEYPYPGPELAKALVERNVKGVGIDAFSIDSIKSKSYEVHKILLNHDVLIVENLTNLSSLLNKSFDFAAFPLKISEADGAPVRAVAFINED